MAPKKPRPSKSAARLKKHVKHVTHTRAHMMSMPTRATGVTVADYYGTPRKR